MLRFEEFLNEENTKSLKIILGYTPKKGVYQIDNETNKNDLEKQGLEEVETPA